MTKQEILKAIENGESVWYVDNCNDKIWEIDLNKKYKPEIYLDQILYVYQNTNDRFKQELFIEKIFKTKAEAEHYLHHANVERVEKLPFLTWEEFLEETRLKFIACDGVSNMILYCCNNTIYLVDEEYPEFNTTSWDLTESNFYKAYDECVRLFRGFD